MISLGQAHETELTLEKAGANVDFWVRIAQDLDLAKAVVAFVMKVFFRLSVAIDRNMEGWACVDPVPVGEGDFEPTLQEFLKPDDNGYVSGEEMLRRAEEKTGLRHAEAMFREQDKIPVDWRKYYLVFPEVWQSPDSSRYVFYLSWSSPRWYLHCYWLDYDFNSSTRLVASRKYQK